MACPWSSSTTSTSGYRASTPRSCAARSAPTAAPVGFCARAVTNSARAPSASTRSTAETTGPSSSTATGTTRRPSAAARSSTLPQPGSSMATASPGRRCEAKTRSIPSSAPEVTPTGPAGTPSASRSARASRCSSGTTGSSPYSVGACAYRRAASARAPSNEGSSRTSGFPEATSRAPGGTAIRSSSRGALAGRPRTRLPRRPSVSMTPRSRSVRYAAATVFGFTPSTPASSRIGGSSAPGASAPDPTPASTLAAISDARRPVIRYSPSTK